MTPGFAFGSSWLAVMHTPVWQGILFVASDRLPVATIQHSSNSLILLTMLNGMRLAGVLSMALSQASAPPNDGPDQIGKRSRQGAAKTGGVMTTDAGTRDDILSAPRRAGFLDRQRIVARPGFKALLAWAAVAILLFWGLWVTLKSVVALF